MAQPTKQSIIQDIRNAIKELNGFICNTEMARVYLEAAIRDLDLWVKSQQGNGNHDGPVLKPAETFNVWLAQLYYVTCSQTGCSPYEVKINEKEAEKWYKDGFTPYQCFRETYNMENDSSL